MTHRTVNLKAWRKLKRETQMTLANKMGTDHTTIGRYERGEIAVDDETFARLAKELGISPAELAAHPEEQKRVRLIESLVDRLRRMEPEQIEATIKVIDALSAHQK